MFDPNTCTKEELMNRCRAKGFSKRNIDFCIMAFYDKICIKELAQTLCMEENSISKKKYRLKIKLNSH